MWILDTAQTADFFDVSRQTVLAWMKSEGLPHERTGTGRGSVKIKSLDVAKWWADRRLNKLRVAESDTEDSDIVQSLTAERARLAKAQADKTELEAAKLKGILVETTDVAEAWSRMIMSARTRLLAIPTRAAAQVAAMDDPVAVQELLTEMIHEALNELAAIDEK